MEKRLLILNASDGDIPLILAAKELGFYVIASGYNTALPGYRYADETAARDYSDKEAMLQLAMETKADAVCANCNDAGIKSASYVAEKLRLPGFDSYATTCLLHNKDTMKRFMQENDIPSPVSINFVSVAEAVEWAKSADAFPYIAKPVDLSAGRGMSVANTKTELERSIMLAHERSRSGGFVIEPYIVGTNHSHSCFLVNGTVVGYYMANEYTAAVNPFCIEGCCSPADDMETVAPILNAAIEKMARILGLTNGLVHTQYVLKSGRPYILEITRRHPGAWYNVCAELATGIPWAEWYVRFQTGYSAEGFPAFHGQSGVWGRHIIMADRNGVVTNVTIDGELEKYTFGAQHFWKPEFVVKDYTVDALGILFLEFPAEKENAAMRPTLRDRVHLEYR